MKTIIAAIAFVVLSSQAMAYDFKQSMADDWEQRRHLSEMQRIDMASWYEVEPVCDLLGDWILMCNGSQWKTVVLAFNVVFASE